MATLASPGVISNVLAKLNIFVRPDKDTWYASGLRGTGSEEVVQDVFVSTHRFPGMGRLSSTNASGLALSPPNLDTEARHDAKTKSDLRTVAV